MLLSAKTVIAAFRRTASAVPAQRRRQVDRQTERLESRCLLSTIPNDPRFGEQIGLQNNGQTGGAVDADIDAPEAWDVQHSAVSFVTAVVDSGADYSHPDLYLNVWLNQGELPAALLGQLQETDNDQRITFRDLNQPSNASFVSDLNGTGYLDAGDLLRDPRWNNGNDEDGNGYPDDLIGWDFVNNDNDPFDEHGHGTHVTGILAARGNNGIGTVGVTWDGQMMLVRFLDRRLQATVGQAVAALNYVSQQRERFNEQVPDAPDVRLENNSWALRTASAVANQQVTAAITRQLQAGLLLVAASGNGIDDRPVDLDAETLATFPATYTPPTSPQQDPIPDALISVAAVDNNDQLLFNSNYGATKVDLAAPGLDILSTEPGGNYGTRTGTSMATPFVAGTAALLWQRYPEASALEIKRAILSGVDPVEALSGKVVTGGRLNAAQALNFDSVAPRATLTSASDIAVRGGTAQDIVITYSDNVGVDVGSLDASDIVVTRADGVPFSSSLALLSVSPAGNGTPRVATYRLAAPNGQWTNSDNATYRITLQPQQVRDSVGNAAATEGRAAVDGQVLGSFTVAIPNPDDTIVTSPVDSTDATPGDGIPRDSSGRATLRAAIQEANADPDTNRIRLSPGTYALTLAGANEDAAATGDLDIRQNVTIEGTDAGTTIIDAQGLDRVLHVLPGVIVTLRNVMVRGGQTTGNGGGLLNQGFLTLDHVIVTSNSAASGGGIFNDVTTTSSNDTLVLLDSTVATNTATVSDGGGLKNLKGKAQLQRSTFESNTATTSGGGLAVQASTVSATNSTFSGNSAGTIGGGLHLNAGGLLLTNVTITLNSAHNGGGLARSSGTARAVNTILSGNTVSAGQVDPDVVGTISATGSGNNFVGILSTGGTAGGFSTARGDLIGTAALPLNANLAPLGNFGGATRTHRPNVGSPVIDVGRTVAGVSVDQRGIARPQDGDNSGTAVPDIGSFEFILFATVAGTEFQDLNFDGVRDPDEPGASGWTVFLDADADGSLESNELRTTTGRDGTFLFENVLPGNYLLRQVARANWDQSLPSPDAPTNGRYELTIDPGQNLSGLDFGNKVRLGEIRGRHYLDRNGNAQQDSGEDGIAGETVFIDVNRNGAFDESEPHAVTDGNGDYSIQNVDPFVPQIVSVERRPGFTGTALPAAFQLSSLMPSNGGDGSRGVVIVGGPNWYTPPEDGGVAVASAGDVNGDGYADLTVGSASDETRAQGAGIAHVILTPPSGFVATVRVATLNGTNGFRLVGLDTFDKMGRSVGSAGDVNGDGYDDVLIGSSMANPNDTDSGAAYVVFGKRGSYPADINPGSLNGTNGFRINGRVGEHVGFAVSSAGDFNNDGFDDILVGADFGYATGTTTLGAAYVIYGKTGAFPAVINTATLNGTDGFQLLGVGHDDFTGTAVNFAGDVNGDGFDDVVIGAPQRQSTVGLGRAFVVFGHAGHSAAQVRLSTLNGKNGFAIEGENVLDRAGFSVSGGGDVNGDGFTDVIVGAPGSDPHGDRAGTSYVVFGKSGEFNASVYLSDLDGSNGFRLNGVAIEDQSGKAVSMIGDFNGDGVDDVAVSAPYSDPNATAAGSSYIVFGKRGAFPAAAATTSSTAAPAPTRSTKSPITTSL